MDYQYQGSERRETALIYYSDNAGNLPYLRDRLEVIQTLLDLGANPFYVSPEGKNALTTAWSSCQIELIGLFIAQGLKPVRTGELNLACPAKAGRADLIQFAISQGSDPNAMSGTSGIYPEKNQAPAFFNAKDVQSLRVMISAGADLNLKDEAGRTLLMYAADHAAWKQDSTLISALLQAGAKKKIKDPNGLTAADYYAQSRGSAKGWGSLKRWIALKHDRIYKSLKP